MIRAINTDRGPEFFAVKKGKKQYKIHDFVAFLNAHSIQHIPSRVKNPQTNGKLERFHQEYEKHRLRFQTLLAFVEWYNHRFHGGVETTPHEALQAKLRPETLINLLFKEMDS